LCFSLSASSTTSDILGILLAIKNLLTRLIEFEIGALIIKSARDNLTFEVDHWKDDFVERFLSK
jgi:hypothetical protein